ncbi:MAG: acyltransferase [Calditrichaeota bacterium]|nr:acyltransferase [Calditrichota bacterium]
MKVGYFQFRPRFGNIQHNLKTVVNALKSVEADLIVLPELPFSGYHFRDRAETLTLSENPQQSPTVATLIDLCRSRNLHIVTGFAEKQADKCFNSALLIGPEGLLHTYRKIHLFSGEKHCFDPGDTPLSVQNVRGATIGIMVCFDWIFPEVTRTLAVLGADIICHPSNLVLAYCQQTMLSRCLENNIFAITCNRFGKDVRPHGELRFTGKSQVVAPKGVLLNRAPSQKTTLFITEINPELARQKSITATNDILSDRRPEFYEPLTS